MATGSTFATLRDNLLSEMDVYNANDLDETEIGSQGWQALRAVNKALQKIYSMVKDSDILEKEAVNSSLTTTSGQDHVDISGITDLDDIENIYEADNDVNLKRISFKEYRRLYPDPSEATGNPIHYAVRGSGRIYIGPRPDATYTLNIYYMRVATDLTTTSSTTALPSKFDYWILAEAAVFWQLMEDRTNTAALNSLMASAADCREKALEDIGANYDLAEEADSHWDQQDAGSGFPRFDSPVGS